MNSKKRWLAWKKGRPGVNRNRNANQIPKKELKKHKNDSHVANVYVLFCEEQSHPS